MDHFSNLNQLQKLTITKTRILVTLNATGRLTKIPKRLGVPCIDNF